VDLMLVIGGKNSANTKRLFELCCNKTITYMIETVKEINPVWLEGKYTIGVTSGTSTPDLSINEVINKLESLSC